jgi:hypothetical protein
MFSIKTIAFIATLAVVSTQAMAAVPEDNKPGALDSVAALSFIRPETNQ